MWNYQLRLNYLKLLSLLSSSFLSINCQCCFWTNLYAFYIKKVNIKIWNYTKKFQLWFCTWKIQIGFGFAQQVMHVGWIQPWNRTRRARMWATAMYQSWTMWFRWIWVKNGNSRVWKMCSAKFSSIFPYLVVDKITEFLGGPLYNWPINWSIWQ